MPKLNRTRFTDANIAALKPRADKRLEKYDSTRPGLVIRVTPNGRKTWCIRYRMSSGGTAKRYAFGTYPTMSLKAARSRAQELLDGIEKGIDPADAKRAKLKKRRDEEIARTKGEYPEGSFGYFVDLFDKMKLKGERSGTEARRYLDVELLSRMDWGNRDLKSITIVELQSVIDSVQMRPNGRGADQSPEAARQLRLVLHRFFEWAKPRAKLDRNPMQDVQVPKKGPARERTLIDVPDTGAIDFRELVAVWRAAEMTKWPFGAIVRLLILTGQRRGEVAAMRWEQIDLDSGVWTLPASVTKNQREHVVHLSSAAVDLLSDLPQVGDSGYIFPVRARSAGSKNGDGERVSTFSAWTKSKRNLDANIAKICAASDDLPESVDGWTLHDLRRTFATGLAALGTDSVVVEKILNHSGGQLSGLAAIYNKHKYLSERRIALTKWSDALGRAIDPNATDGEKVVALHA